jgi:hypothetical protein
MLVHLYAVSAWGQTSKSDLETPRTNGLANGHANGHIRADRTVRDAEEFELAGLDSDDDDENEPLRSKETRPLVAHH